MNKLERNVYLEDLHIFVHTYESMLRGTNIPNNIIERNKSIIRDFLNSYVTYLENK